MRCSSKRRRVGLSLSLSSAAPGWLCCTLVGWLQRVATCCNAIACQVVDEDEVLARGSTAVCHAPHGSQQTAQQTTGGWQRATRIGRRTACNLCAARCVLRSSSYMLHVSCVTRCLLHVICCIVASYMLSCLLHADVVASCSRASMLHAATWCLVHVAWRQRGQDGILVIDPGPRLMNRNTFSWKGRDNDALKR